MDGEGVGFAYKYVAQYRLILKPKTAKTRASARHRGFEGEWHLSARWQRTALKCHTKIQFRSLCVAYGAPSSKHPFFVSVSNIFDSKLSFICGIHRFCRAMNNFVVCATKINKNLYSCRGVKS